MKEHYFWLQNYHKKLTKNYLVFDLLELVSLLLPYNLFLIKSIHCLMLKFDFVNSLLNIAFKFKYKAIKIKFKDHSSERFPSEKNNP